METYKDHITLTPDMNEERLNTLRELFPDWFTQEGHLDINEVKKAVNPDSVEETERYEFRWFGKSAAKRNALPSVMPLRLHELHCITMQSVALMLKQQIISLLKAKISKS